MPRNKKSKSAIAWKNERAGRHNLKKHVEKLVEREAQEVADALEAEQGWIVANQHFERSKRARSSSPSTIYLGSSPLGSPTGALAMARVAKQPRLQSPARGAATLALPPISNFAPMARSARQPRMQSIAAPTFAIPAILNFASLAGRSAPIPVIQDTARGGLGTQRKTTTGQVTGRSSRNPTGDARPQNAVVAGQSPGYRGGYTLPAQPPGAPYDYWKERDYILQVNVGRKFSECSNEMITQIYGSPIESDEGRGPDR